MRTLRRAVVQEARRNSNLNLFCAVMVSVVLPAALAMLISKEQKIDGDIFWWIVGAIIAIHLIMSSFVFLRQDSLILSYFRVIDLEASVKDKDAQLEQARISIDYNLLVFNIGRAWDEMLVESRSRPPETHDEFVSMAGNILGIVSRSVGRIFRCGSDELWNMALYVFHSDEHVLIPVWRDRHPSHPSVSLGRSWHPGQGHVGKAYADGAPKITQDALDPEVAALMAPPASLVTPHDTIYRSYASFPIVNGNGQDVLGVVVVTSDVAGRFSKANTTVLLGAASAIAELIRLTHNDSKILFEPSTTHANQ